MMKKKTKLILGLVLFILGLSGVLSMLTMEIPLSEEVQILLLEKFTAQQIEFLKIVNPLTMMTGALLLGLFMHEKVQLDVPVIRGIIEKSQNYHLPSIFKYGTIGGLIAGVILSLITILYSSILPQEFIELGESLEPTLAARFLYGGFTEEILMRFGLMTFIIWLFSSIFKSSKESIYWIGIILAALIFAVSHFPVAFQSLSSPSITVLSYILIANSFGGVIFGWLYWKKGLESAFIAHISAHIVMVLAELL